MTPRGWALQEGVAGPGQLSLSRTVSPQRGAPRAARRHPDTCPLETHLDPSQVGDKAAPPSLPWALVSLRPPGLSGPLTQWRCPAPGSVSRHTCDFSDVPPGGRRGGREWGQITFRKVLRTTIFLLCALQPPPFILKTKSSFWGEVPHVDPLSVTAGFAVASWPLWASFPAGQHVRPWELPPGPPEQRWVSHICRRLGGRSVHAGRAGGA